MASSQIGSIGDSDNKLVNSNSEKSSCSDRGMTVQIMIRKKIALSLKRKKKRPTKVDPPSARPSIAL